MEYQLLDRMSCKRFCGLANATHVPDRTTVWTFENRIGEAGAKALFDGVSAQLLKRVSSHAAVKSSTPPLPRPKQHNSRGEGADRARCDARRLEAGQRRQKDPTRPGRRSTARATSATSSINVDKKYKIIRRIETDTASSTHDSQHFDNVFDAGNTSRDVYADRGYPSEGREAWLKENGFRNQIQRKGKRNKPLTECQQRRNQRIAKTRARVEHVFGALEQMGGKLLRTIGQARASFAMTMMAACCNLKRLVSLRKAGIEAF